MQEKVFFPNSQGVNLCGVLSNPSQQADVPIVVLCHGFTTSKDSFTNQKLEGILNSRGIASFRIDFFGHGESGGDFADITISEGADDILSAIRYLKGKGFTKMGLVGSSFGGMCSLVAASRSSDLAVLALKSPVSDYPEVEHARRSPEEMAQWKSRGYLVHSNSYGDQRTLNYSFVEDFEKHDGYAAAKKIRIPTLLVHGDKDASVPIAQSKRTAGLLQDGRLVIVEGADHNYSNPAYFQKMLSLISSFLVKHLAEG